MTRRSRRFDDEPVLLGPPGSPEQHAQVSRIDAMAMVSAGVLGLSIVALVAAEQARPDGYHGAALAGVSTLSLIVAAVTRRRAIPIGLAVYGYPLALVAITAATWAAGPALGPVVAMFYMWAGGTVTHLSRRRSAGIIGCVAVTYGALLAFQRGNALPFVRWEIVVVATGTFAVTTARMVARSWSLADSEREARAHSERTRTALEAVNDQKTLFLARMSHELRTPLNAIIGFSEVLAGKAFGPLNTKQAEYVDDVVDSGRHLLSLVDDLLDVSKVESGAVELNLGSVELAPLLAGCVELFQEQAGRRRLSLTLDVASGPTHITADARKVRQVVLNLVSNAVKFTPDGGRIEVRTWSTSDGTRISVADSGRGIADTERDAIFLEFHQGSPSAGATRGTGLGLPLARRFVEMHGGRLWVESGSTGATFTAELPRQPQLSEAAPSPADPEVVVARIFGEPDSPERRAETVWMATIVGIGVSLASAIMVIAYLTHPAQAFGAKPLLFVADVGVCLGILAGMRRIPQILVSPRALTWACYVAATGLCASTYLLGPEWGQFSGMILAWIGVAAVLAFGVRASVYMIGFIAIGEAIAYAVTPGVVAPVTRWAVTVGYIVATAVIFRPFVVRIRAMTEADERAKTEADRVGLQLALAARHKTQFVADMSHELRTPLNAIIGFSEVLESQAFGPLNAKQREYVTDVLSAGRHLLRLINEILDLAKVEAGRMDLHTARADARELVASVIARFDRQAEQRDVRIDLDAAGVGMCDVDEAKLRFVLTNLISNALKFAPRGGCVAVRAVAGADFVEISVADGGPGIPSADLERIFDAFSHGGHSTSTDQGSGLGLTLSRRYAELHGGSLTVKSAPGAGATFTLRLPAAAVSAEVGAG